jgi:hypothetical protein
MTPEKLIPRVTSTDNSNEPNPRQINSVAQNPMQDQMVLEASQFVAFRTPIDEIQETMLANFGGSTISIADLERIRIPAGGGTMWTTFSGENVKELTGIVLMLRDERAYWKSPMESGAKAPPDCQSPDARKGIGSPGGDCRCCKFAQFGSARLGAGQACKQVRLVFLLMHGNLFPVIVSLPVSSIKPSQHYLIGLAGPCYSVITKIGLEKDRNAQGIEFSRATFTGGGPLSQAEAKRAKEYRALIESCIDASSPPSLVRIQAEEGEVV